MDTAAPTADVIPAPPPADLSLRARFFGALDAITAQGIPPAYLVCAPLALYAIWGHHFQPGIDMPQHANTMRLWLELRNGPAEYAILYKEGLFTPYLLTYALAYPVAKWFGAMAGVKAILTIAALGTPLTMARWLRIVGGDPRLGILAFPIVFGFPYVWGFLSHCLGLCVLFGYLASFEDQGERPSFEKILNTSGWGIVLFFSHGVTFGLACVSVGIRLVARRKPFAAWRAGLHLIPMAAATLFWLATRERQVAAASGPWFANRERLIVLFSGLFEPRASVTWALVVVGVLAVSFAIARPRVNRSLGVWIPFLVTTACFLILPSFVASTSVMGPRFSAWVQAFACGLFVAGPSRERRLELTAYVVVIANLILLQARLTIFNHELDDYATLAARVGPRNDVQTYMPKLAGASEVFGFRNLSEAPAWLTAENGGLIADDYGRFYQMPVQHQHTRFPKRYRYVFTLVDDAAVKKEFPDAALVQRAGQWSLYERAPIHVGDIEVVRSAQSWGDLAQDLSVIGKPLVIGGVTFEHGLGTQASAFIRVRAREPQRQTTLEGACGVDDSAADETSLTCRILGRGKKVVWTATAVKGGEPKRFRVALDEHGEALLEVTGRGGKAGANADWIDLK